MISMLKMCSLLHRSLALMGLFPISTRKKLISFLNSITVLHCIIQAGDKRRPDAGKPEVLERLIRLGADVNAQNFEGAKICPSFPWN